MGKYATKEQLTALVADMASKINIASGTQGVSGSYVPIGCIEAFMGVEAPPDFLVCDGSLHSIASYPQLADHFYEQFGASNHFGGNGTTTFAVPDLRGEFLRGTGTNSHENQGSGASVGNHQDGTEIPRVAYDGTSVIIPSVSSYTTPQNIDASFKLSSADKGANVGNPWSGGGYGAYTSRPTNTSVLWCIKAIDTKFDPEIQMVKYSTEEQLIGTWIDGKLLYQKSIEITQIPNKQLVTINHNIANIDRITDIKGICFAKPSADPNYTSSLIPCIQDNATNANMSVDVSRVSVMIKGRGENFSDLYDKVVVTLQYTKTT